MEDRSTIREIHGIANFRKCSAAAVKDSDTKGARVVDGDGEVFLCLDGDSFPAGMTPAQARLFAKLICESADRVDRP